MEKKEESPQKKEIPRKTFNITLRCFFWYTEIKPKKGGNVMQGKRMAELSKELLAYLEERGNSEKAQAN